MKHLFVALAVLLGACATATAQPSTGGAPITWGASYTLEFNGQPHQVNVWTPPDYAETDQRYDVLYLIDGGLDQDFGHITGLAHLGWLSWTYEPLIVVGIRTGERIHELTPAPTDPRYRAAFPNAGGAPSFRRYIETAVIPFVEANYRTRPRRALIGESLAGLFVVDTLLNQPTLFNDYIAVSPSLWWDDRALARSAAAQAARPELLGRRLYLAIADEGGTMQDGVDRLRTALAAAPHHVELRYSDRSATETHATIFHGAALEALRWLYASEPYDTGPTPWYMSEGASPPAQQ